VHGDADKIRHADPAQAGEDTHANGDCDLGAEYFRASD
jgi:hypothetical protein